MAVKYLDSTGLSHLWSKIKGYFVKGNAQFFYGTCDSAAADTVKVVTCPDFAQEDLTKGSTISVFFTVTNSAAVASLQLNVNGTGAKNIKHIYNGANTNIPGAGYIKANQIYQFTYDGTYWIVQMMYNTNTDTSYVLYYTNPTAGPGGLQKYSLFMQTANHTYSSFTTTSGTGTTKTKNTIGFKPGKLLYHGSSGDKAAGASVGNNIVKEATSLLDLRYSGNQGSTLVAKKPVYVVGTIDESDGLFYLDDDWISQDVPTSEDGKVYIYIGLVYDTYRCDLDAYNPMYHFSRGAFRLYQDRLETVETTYPEIDMIVNA